jgi:predicted MFS family arabinose efflux permease
MDMRLIWLALGAFAIGTGAFVIASLLPGIAGDMQVSVPQAGSLVLAYAISYAVGGPILATLTGGMNRRPVIVGTILLFAAGNLVAGIATSFATIVIARIVMALGAGLFTAAALGAAVALSTPQTRARAISVIVGGTTASVALGAPLGSLIANAAGWRGAFLATAALSLVVTLALWIMLPRNQPGTRLSMRNRVMVIFRPGIGGALAVTLFTLAAVFTLFTFIAKVVTDSGLAIDVLPLVLLGFGVGAVVGNYASGQFADRIGPSRTVSWVLATSSGILVLFSLIGYLVPAPAAGWLIAALMVPWGFVGWGFPPAQTSRIVSLAPDAAPISLSLNISALYFGVALGSVIGGGVLTFGSSSDLGWVGALCGGLALATHAYVNRVPKGLVFRQG